MDPLTLATLVDHIRRAMDIAEEAIESGDKAAYAQEIILRMIAESDMNEAEKAMCRTIVETGVLKDIFTLVVDATKGKLNINKVKKDTQKCCYRWFPLCCSKPKTEDDVSEDTDDPLPIEPTPTPTPDPNSITASTRV
jgi:hypothetical protein